MDYMKLMAASSCQGLREWFPSLTDGLKSANLWLRRNNPKDYFALKVEIHINIMGYTTKTLVAHKFGSVWLKFSSAFIQQQANLDFW